MNNLFSQTKDGITFEIRVTPNASKNLIEITDEMIKVKVTAIPDDNKANEAVVKLLSKHFKVAKSKIEIISGHKNRNKKILLKDVFEITV